MSIQLDSTHNYSLDLLLKAITEQLLQDRPANEIGTMDLDLYETVDQLEELFPESFRREDIPWAICAELIKDRITTIKSAILNRN